MIEPSEEDEPSTKRAESVFIAGPPIEHPRNFFGREKELKWLFSLLKTHPLQNVVIIGKRRSGKTSLLNYLRRITTTPVDQLRPGQKYDWLPNPQAYRWIFVDFQDARMAQRERLLRFLLKSMEVPVPDSCNLESFMDQDNSRISQPTVILMDNIDIGLQRCSESDSYFWNSFLSLTMNQKHENLTFIMTSSEELTGLLDSSSSFSSFYSSTISLKQFTENEVRELINSSPLPFTETDIDRILAASNGWPSLAQKECESHLFYLKSNRPNSDFFISGIQLLLQFVWQPSVWQKQLQRLNPSLNKSFLIMRISRKEFWKQKEIRQLLLQALLLLPVLCVLPLIAGLSLPINNLVAWGKVFLGILYIVVTTIFTGLLLGLSSSMQLISIIGFSGICILLLRVFLILSHELIFISAAAIFIIGIWSNLLFSMTYETSHLGNESINATNVVVSIFVGLSAGVIFGYSYDSLFGLRMFGAFLSGYAVGVWRALIIAILFTPWNILIYQLDKRRTKIDASLLVRHLVFWNELQYLPVWGLYKHFLLVIEKNPIEGQRALNHLKESRQSFAAQSIQLKLTIRQLYNCHDVFAISQIQRSLIIDNNSADKILRAFSNIVTKVNSALRQPDRQKQCTSLTTVLGQLNNLTCELGTSNDKYAKSFHSISQCWQDIINLHCHKLIEELNSPYIHSGFLPNGQQLFVGRTDISERLEKLLLDRRSPPLLLYGQRRTGKTSLLNNLGRLLPTSIIPLFVDLQGISSANDHTGFLYSLAKDMVKSAQQQRNIELPYLPYETLAVDPFMRFNEWLDTIETALAAKTALLALDEFEVLDQVLRIGRFNEADILGMLRNLIQHRPKFKVLISGSHTLNEYQHWSSYLINAQVIHIGYLKEAEARQLIEQPIENFALRYQPPASQRVLDVTRGHPLFVQLLCAEIVALKNDQDPSIRRLATLADVEAAIPEALAHGSMFFSDIERNQLDDSALAVLRYCAQQGEGAIISKLALKQQFVVGVEESIDLLLRRELIETQPSGYSIQLELIRRWFSQNWRFKK